MERGEEDRIQERVRIRKIKRIKNKEVMEEMVKNDKMAILKIIKKKKMVKEEVNKINLVQMGLHNQLCQIINKFNLQIIIIPVIKIKMKEGQLQMAPITMLFQLLKKYKKKLLLKKKPFKILQTLKLVLKMVISLKN
jgi:hypothetical protein